MSGGELGMLARAADLRRRFDESFAEPPLAERPAHVDLLAVRIASEPFALRLGEVGGLLSGRKVVPLPTTRPDFMGVIGHRGLIIPVYGLRAILGYPRGEDARWMVLTGGTERVGLTFDLYEGFLRLPAAQVAPPGRAEAMPPHMRDVARLDDSTRPVLDLRSILDAIKQRTGPHARSEER